MRAELRPLVRVATALLGLALVVACGDGTAGRRAEVAERGAKVMPFDLSATTHRFTKTSDGGVQTVTADDPADNTQVRLIRQHLREERDNFAGGDYDDPARIHGMNMPGVAQLRAGYERISVSYSNVVSGAELTYTTNDTDLVDAIHAWFDRQVMDHGAQGETG